jgi:NAD(P)-dependent dehydrogenase (short-subunit alcohol dehydrogenase family)
MSLYAMLKRPGPSGFGYASTAEDVTAGLALGGKTILVTGCTSGIGLETLRVLALRGARVLGAARTADKARAACEAAGAGRAVPLACDLSDPGSVRACVEAVKALGERLDAVVCNAGVMALPRREVAHGIELQLFTNHVGHFLLVTGLLDALAGDGRVVVVASEAHRNAPREGIRFDDLGAEREYSPWKAYGQSKLANLLFTKELARRLAGSGRTANALHPGVIHTNLTRHLPAFADALYGFLGKVVLKTIPQGAATQTYVAVHPGAARESGAYFADCNVATPRPDATDPALAARLWEVTEGIVARLPGAR